MRWALAWAPPALWALVLFMLSELRVAPPMARAFFLSSDKVVHFLLYLAFGALLAWARHIGGRGIPHVVLVAIGAAYGGLDEFHQAFVPRRSPDIEDWFADTAGVMAGYAALTWWLAWRGRETIESSEE
jgi:VanZ family protein